MGQYAHSVSIVVVYVTNQTLYVVSAMLVFFSTVIFAIAPVLHPWW